MSQHTYSTSSPSPHHSSLATSRLIAFSGGDYHLSGAAGSSALACGCGQGNCYGTTVHQHCSNTMSNAGNCSSSPSTPLRNSDGSDSLGWSNGESDHVCAGTGSGSMAGALSTAATLSSVVHQKRFRAQGRLSNAIANSKNGSDGCCCWLPGDANSAKSSHFSLHAKTPDSSCKSTPSTRPGTHLTTPASSATHHKGTALNEAASSDSATVRKALDQWFGVSSASDSGNASMRVDVAGMPADQSVGAAAGLPFLERGGSVGSGGVAPCSGTSVSCRSFCRGASSDLKKASDPTKSSGTSHVHAKVSDISGISPQSSIVSSTKRSVHQKSSTKTSSTTTTTETSSVLDATAPVYRGPDPLPTCLYRRLYDPAGPVMFPFPPLQGAQHARAEIRLWPRDVDRVLSQNSSKRKVHRAVWLSPVEPKIAFPVALKFVEDGNVRDGRSIKREIECHLYIYQRLGQLMAGKPYARLEDAWPCAEMFGYYLDKKNPGMSVLVTRKLSGPDFFDVIRTEHTSTFTARTAVLYEQHKLQWCLLAMERIAQYGRLGIRHNDIKPDNIVLDFYAAPDSNERLLDVKLIDLGTASMQHAKDFTGGTSWYESPEQKVLEYHTKKQRNLEAAKQVDIGLPSDAWGAGLSITEVLMGRRVVDVMKPPLGPGPLDFRGTEGWVVEPKDWVQCARHALGLDREQQRFPLCAEAARLVFSMLVRPKPAMRATVEDVLPHMRLFAEESALQALRKYHDTTGCDATQMRLACPVGNSNHHHGS